MVGLYCQLKSVVLNCGNGVPVTVILNDLSVIVKDLNVSSFCVVVLSGIGFVPS